MVTSRIWFTPTQKTELWERWKQGESISAISRALERRNKTGVQRIVALHGGIAPLPRRRAVSALRLEEREEISRGRAGTRPKHDRLLGARRSVQHHFRQGVHIIRRRNGDRENLRSHRPG